MARDKAIRVIKIETLILFLIICLGVFISLIPRMDYAYPVHLDEWFGMACANQILNQDSAFNLLSPFNGSPADFFQSAEFGFHLLIGLFHEISGIDWLIIFRFLPSLIFVFTIISAYLMGKKLGFGLEAAAFISILPTSVGVLGPAFLVPVAAGILFIPLSLFVMFGIEGFSRNVLLFLFITYLLSSHAYTAVAVWIMILPYLVLTIKDNRKSSILTFLAITLPFLVAVPFAIDLIRHMLEAFFGRSELSPFIQYPFIVQSLGYILIGACLLGTLYISVHREKRSFSFLLGFLILAVILFVYRVIGFGIDGLYERGILFTMVAGSIVAGAGAAAIRKIKIPEGIFSKIKNPAVVRYTGLVAGVILVIAAAATTIPVRLETKYYHMIDAEDYRAFTWIRENIGDEMDRAVCNPWKGTAFTAVTGKKVYTRIVMAAFQREKEVYDFLWTGSSDTSFLRRIKISLLYTREEVNNPDLKQVADYVYMLE